MTTRILNRGNPANPQILYILIQTSDDTTVDSHH